MVDGDQTVNISVTVSPASTDSTGYKTATIPTETVTVTDDDELGINLDTTAVSLNENDVIAITVRP